MNFYTFSSRHFDNIKNLMNMPISFKKFSLICLFILFVLPLLSITINLLNMPSNANELILWQQLNKIENVKNKDAINSVILGDSSAGNAIDAQLFSKLTNTNSLNLSLTGSIGLEGIMIMTNHAKKNFPNLEYIFYTIAPPTWGKEFSPEGYYIFKYKSEHINLNDMPKIKEAELGFFNWLATPKRLLWFLKFKYFSGNKKEWDYSIDYLKQNPILKFERADRNWKHPLNTLDINRLNSTVQHWNKLCENVKCFFSHGPIYKKIKNSSKFQLDEVNKIINTMDFFVNAETKDKYTFVDYNFLGDTRNHVKVKYKDISTKYYADIFMNKALKNISLNSEY